MMNGSSDDFSLLSTVSDLLGVLCFPLMWKTATIQKRETMAKKLKRSVEWNNFLYSESIYDSRV